MVINRDDLGDDWPFVVDSVVIKRRGTTALHVRPGPPHKIKIYALNGSAKTHLGLPEMDGQIWADNPEIPGTKKSLSPLFRFINGKV